MCCTYFVDAVDAVVCARGFRAEIDEYKTAGRGFVKLKY